MFINHRYTWGSSGQVNLSEMMLFDGFFNWSMSNRTDSDIPFPYGSIKMIPNRELNHEFVPSTALASYLKLNMSQSNNNGNKNQSAVVAWMSSHCPTHGRREDYIRQLKRYIKVDS